MYVAVGCVAKHETSPVSTTAAGAEGAASPASVSVGRPRSDLIPRAVLFGNPECSAAQLSPDGKWISWLAPSDGVLNVWVAPADDLAKAKPVTAAKKQPVLESECRRSRRHA